MPKFYEIFGKVDYKTMTKYSLQCPFTLTTCDGGGNRHQTAISMRNHQNLIHLFSEPVDKVIPAVCSIKNDSEIWIVCPRRLLGFKSSSSQINFSLQQHEKEALIKSGLPTNQLLGVWSEVFLKYGNDDSSINYHFDFVITPILENQTLNNIFLDNKIEYSEMDLKELQKILKISKKQDILSTCIPVLPDLTSPFIIEVMTASTSGSNKIKGNDIPTAFLKTIQGYEHEAPSINKRQVWGRMATQLFAKSMLASSWNGKTIWFVQDSLLNDIALTTKMNLIPTKVSSKETVNFLSFRYLNKHLVVDKYIEKTLGIDLENNNTCADILLPKTTPNKIELLKAMLRGSLVSKLML